jgi:hypothetical protein
MIENENKKIQLRFMFSILNQVPGAVDCMADCFSTHYRADAQAKLNDSLSNASTFMEVF